MITTMGKLVVLQVNQVTETLKLAVLRLQMVIAIRQLSQEIKTKHLQLVAIVNHHLPHLHVIKQRLNKLFLLVAMVNVSAKGLWETKIIARNSIDAKIMEMVVSIGTNLLAPMELFGTTIN